MSWLSEGLAKIGISKNTQRAATGVAGAILAPATGGASLAVAGAMVKGSSGQPVPAAAQGFQVMYGQAQPTAPVATAPAAAASQSFMQKYGVPLAIGGGALLLVVVTFAVLRK